MRLLFFLECELFIGIGMRVYLFERIGYVEKDECGRIFGFSLLEGI